MLSLLSLFLPPLLIPLTSATSPQCDCYIDDAQHVWTDRIHFDFSKGDPGDAIHQVFKFLEGPYEGNTVKNQVMDPAQITFHDGIMELQTKNMSGKQYSANLKSWSAMQYGSFRVHMAVDGADGGVAGFFVWRDAWHEQDVEILTSDGEEVIRYTNHITDSSGPLAGENPHLIPELDTSWRKPSFHRFDWLPWGNYFFFNDMKGKPWELDKGAPDQACTFQLNMWSCGDNWGGSMMEGQSASMKIDWIEAVFNSTSEILTKRDLGDQEGAPGAGAEEVVKRATGGCQTVCKIDGVKVQGVPEPVRGVESA